MAEIIAGLAWFAFVFFKAFQQKNVAFDHYKWIIPISYCMSATEIAVISIVSIKAVNATEILQMLPMVFAVGTGGGLGAIAAMWLHNRYVK